MMIVAAKNAAEMSPSPTPSRVIPTAAPGSRMPETSTMPATAVARQIPFVRVRRSPSTKGDTSIT